MRVMDSGDRQRLLELLRDQHSFPTAHRVQVIVRNEDATVDAVLVALAAQVTLEGEAIRHVRQPSRNGTYVSLRVHVPVAAAEDVLLIYERLGQLEGVINYF